MAHVFVKKFDELHTVEKSGLKVSYYSDEKSMPLPVVIVDYETARRVEHPRYYNAQGERLSSEEINKIDTSIRDSRQCSILSTKTGTKFGLVGAVFNDTPTLRILLQQFGSEELPNPVEKGGK